MGKYRKSPKVNMERLAGAMYAAREFEKAADCWLGLLGIGVKRETMGRSLEVTLRNLKERIAELEK